MTLAKDFENNFLKCGYTHLCGGCSLPYLDTRLQLQAKRDHLWSLLEQKIGGVLPEIQTVSVGHSSRRDWIDLQIRGTTIGLMNRETKQLVDLFGCPQMHPDLENWYATLRPVLPQVKKGSFRLRIGPNDLRGVWLDFANTDVRDFLQSKSQPETLHSLGIVEIGQRRKRLQFVDGNWKLREPVLENWFETYLFPEMTPAPLFLPIAGFSQPSRHTNRRLIAEFLSVVSDTGANEVLEYGSGCGNLSLPLASLGVRVKTFEIDELASEGLRRAALNLGLSDRIESFQTDFQTRSCSASLKTDLMVVDPPRSGLKLLAHYLAGGDLLPEKILYISCYPSSFTDDLLQLKSKYRLQSVKIIDQFPQTQHYEILALLTRL